MPVTAVRLHKGRVVLNSSGLLDCIIESYKTYSMLQPTAVQGMTHAYVGHSLLAVSITYLAIQVVSTDVHTDIHFNCS